MGHQCGRTGFYHCCRGKGGGLCAYTDISLCIHFLQVPLNILKGDDY
ncbi:putative histone deacetylase [Rosa chinensis]|uniref:Putative histone deacetylase n=1 Tax=Rosa chinensis TaxID=74649 RepID=A0A2P6QB09_ROSCH|nr:putative histone deacetylase [Rosa chinensis]